MTKTKITMATQGQDYAQWYLDVAHQSNMFEYAPVTGCITFLPKAVTLWNMLREIMGKKMKAMGVQDIMLPLLIPVSFFEREKDHIEGFAPEFLTVTHVWGKELPEHFAIRPTSETLFCDFFKKQLQSYKDLPLLYNQWANVMRWEKRPRPFLRTSEFHWQEGHTLHLTEQDAHNFLIDILNHVYIETIREYMAIDGLEGEKSPSERFPGALHTYTFESMMSNGWALQSCTSHLLSQDFMKEFDVSYQDKEGKQAHPYYTSWGASTRLLGALISSHSDDRWLVMPPMMSEYLATLLPLYANDEAGVKEYTNTIAKTLLWDNTDIPVQGQYFRARINDNNEKILLDARDVRLGEKINDWELSGYPIRIEYGPRDMTQWSVVVADRIIGEKNIVLLSELKETIYNLLKKGQQTLFEKSRNRLQENTVVCNNESDIAAAVESGKFALYAWDGDEKFETHVKTTYKATTRCIPFAGQFTDNLMPEIEKWKMRTIFARAF